MRHFRKVLLLVFMLSLCPLVGAGTASAQTGSTPLRNRVLALATSSSLGVTVRDLGQSDQTAKIPGGKGAYVTGVTPESAAEKAGIRAGDVIVELDGEQVRSAAMLSRLVTETPAGQAVKIVVMREGKRLEVTATLEAGDRSYTLAVPNTPWVEGRDFFVRPPILQWDEPQTPRDPSPPRYSPPQAMPRFAPPLWRYSGGAQLGVTVQDLTPQLMDYFKVKQGVLVSSVAADSAAARSGIRAGDVITMVDKVVVRTSDDLRRLLEERQAGDRVTVGLMRERTPMTLTVTLEGPRARVRPI